MGTATGMTPTGSISDDFMSHYFGQDPSIMIIKKTNGDPAQTKPGPYISEGAPVTWTYEVTNTGNVNLTNVVVTDNVTGYIGTISLLMPCETNSILTGSGNAARGQYTNIGNATGKPPVGSNVSDENLSHYFGLFSDSPPGTPTPPSGNRAGISSTDYIYSTSTTDLDGDQISYTFDWGDGTNTTTFYFNSTENASSTHSWNSPGQYNIRVKATDSKGASSEWSEARTITIYRQGWHGLGGAVISNPFTIKDDQGRTHILVKGGDNALWDNLDGNWLPLGGVITSDPYAVKDGQGKIHVLVRGGDAALWDRVLDGGWTNLGGAIASNPSAALSADNHVKVAVKGTDNALWLKDITTGSWTSLGGFITSNPQAILDANGRMHILVRGGDNALWDNIDGSWKPLGGFITSDPKPLQNPNDPGYIHTYVQGGDRALWRNDLDTGADTATWQGLGGVIVQNEGIIDMGNSATVVDVNGVAHAFVQGSDRSLWDNADGNWQGFGGFAKSSPNAVRDENGWLQVAIVGGDDGLWVNRYGPA
jgi:hypothetical protein